MVRRVCVTREWKAAHGRARRAPAPPIAPGAAVFSGGVYLLNLVVDTGGTTVAVGSADLAVALEYLTRAAPAIEAYASAYGPARLAVSGAVLPLTVSVAGASYSDRDVQTWVRNAVTSHALGPDAAVVLLNPPGLVNDDAKESGGVGVLGYHGFAGNPYAFVNLLGSGLTLADPSDRFAEALSHEIAEMTVDPRADGSAPEVCDGCGTNCQGARAFRVYFDSAGEYLGGSVEFPPPFSYAYFLSAVAEPAHAADCPAPASACVYAPP